MVTNEQKRIYNESKPRERDNKNQLLNLQLYQPSKPKGKIPGTVPNPSVFYPNYVPNPFDPIGYSTYLNYIRQNQTPILKEYNININGVSGSHVKTSILFEDILPTKSVSNSFATLGERVVMYESLRSTLFANGDGYDVQIDTSAYNILSHIKLMDINPYNASKYSNNPYMGLSYGFILYRSCYPIRHDPRNSTSQCSRNSTGVNVRVYRLTEGCYLANKNDVSGTAKYDVWRDIAFYNYVKEDIIKKKVCPNFALIYGYNITLKSGIDYDTIKAKADMKINKYEMANKSVPLTNKLEDFDLRPVMRVKHDPKTGTVTHELVHPKMNPVLRQIAEAKKLISYDGKSLVCLTEAPNYSVIGWAKKEYRTDGNIKRMINPGYHPANVWKSVIFQLMVGLYTMQLKNIVINDFSLERNVFIKDIDTGGKVTNHWKYVIDGIQYYIPNYGYLVLIDTNYRDFDKEYKEDETEMKDSDRKIDGLFISDCKLTRDDCERKALDMLKRAVDVNAFGQVFLNDNGARPPEEILKLLTAITDDINTSNIINISYYIRKYMTSYLHNRIGTLLFTTETPNINLGGGRAFRKGQIIVMQDVGGTNRFVLYIGLARAATLARILTCADPDPANKVLVEREVAITSLHEYALVEPIKQTFDMNKSNLNEESLLEVYNVI